MSEDYDMYWEDREATKKIDGKFANRIYVQPVGDGMVRINLGEVLDDEPSYHTAVVVTAERAVDFAKLLQRVAEEIVELGDIASKARNDINVE